MDLGLWTRLFRPLSPGPKGERAAARFLRRARYRILAKNVTLAGGEIDLLAQAPDGRTIVIVEVKAAEIDPAAAGDAPRIFPEAHVNHTKRRRLVHLASQVVKRYRLHDRPIRFDVIGVDLPPDGKPVVRHHIGAFESHV